MATTKVSVRDFVGASKTYVQAQLKKADANKDGKVSIAESGKLPKDLQDNLANFKAATHPRGAVSVKQFTSAFEKYVLAVSTKADKNHDGYLTKTDAGSLPKDLKDNYLNYYNATHGTSAVGAIDLSKPETLVAPGRQAMKDYVNTVLFNTANPEGSSFRNACLDDNVHSDYAKTVKTQMLAQAATWDPQTTKDSEGEDWEKFEGTGAITFGGRFWGLYSEISLQPGKAPSMYVEID